MYKFCSKYVSTRDPHAMQQVSVIDARAYQAACKSLHAELDDPVEDMIADCTLHVTREVGNSSL